MDKLILKNQYEYKYIERRIRHIFEDRKSQINII